VVFPEDEARHAVKVLRLAPGDLVTVVDGAGGEFLVRMETLAKRTVIGAVESKSGTSVEPAVQVAVGLALLKQSARFETFLEKAVELGAHEIIPLTTARSESSSFRRARAEAIMVSALKQSGRTVLPVLHDVTRLEDALREPPSAAGGARLMAHEGTGPASHIRRVLPADASQVTILIGPEGGFTDEEVHAGDQHGWTQVWLGARRLRAETAAMTALGFIITSLE
jgi:16S rRNA (uracil1498-N3)-methyltransferase